MTGSPETKLRGIFTVLLCMLVAGCATDGAGLPNVGCSVFHSIRWSKKDTKETVRQVQGHNAAGVKLCGWKK